MSIPSAWYERVRRACGAIVVVKQWLDGVGFAPHDGIRVAEGADHKALL